MYKMSFAILPLRMYLLFAFKCVVLSSFDSMITALKLFLLRGFEEDCETAPLRILLISKR